MLLLKDTYSGITAGGSGEILLGLFGTESKVACINGGVRGVGISLLIVLLNSCGIGLMLIHKKLHDQENQISERRF